MRNIIVMIGLIVVFADLLVTMMFTSLTGGLPL
jgi:hypothetical protein